MRGTIQKIETNKNKELVFFGEIRGEDGRTYRFDLRNWTDKSLTIEDIPNFADTGFAFESNVLWKIAATYNALQDEDFVFSGS